MLHLEERGENREVSWGGGGVDGLILSGGSCACKPLYNWILDGL